MNLQQLLLLQALEDVQQATSAAAGLARQQALGGGYRAAVRDALELVRFAEVPRMVGSDGRQYVSTNDVAAALVGLRWKQERPPGGHA